MSKAQTRRGRGCRRGWGRERCTGVVVRCVTVLEWKAMSEIRYGIGRAAAIRRSISAELPTKVPADCEMDLRNPTRFRIPCGHTFGFRRRGPASTVRDGFGQEKLRRAAHASCSEATPI